MLTYFFLNIATVFFPVILSFDKKVNYYGKWRFALPAMLFTAIFFIFWDSLFTGWEVWHFNPDYLTGYYFLNLPLEEWLFFFTIPFALIFIYEVVKHYFAAKKFNRPARILLLIIAGASFLMAAIFFQKAYTFTVFGFLGIFLIYVSLGGVLKTYGAFLIAFLISLIPFYIVNGILTSLPVVIYNKQEILQLYVGTIPVEDHFYNLLLMGMNVVIYESLREFNRKRISDPRRIFY